MSACTSATEGEAHKMRSDRNTHAEYPPNDTDYTLIEVEFVPNGKRYAYFAPAVSNGRRLKPGDIVSVDVSNTAQHRELSKIKDVRVRNVLNTIVTRAGRDCKTIVGVLRRCSEGSKTHAAYMNSRQENSTIAALDLTHVPSKVDAAFDFETHAVADFKDKPPPFPNAQFDVYRYVAQCMAQKTAQQRILSMPPALGAGYNTALKMEDLRKQIEAIRPPLRGKRITGVVFDDILDPLAYGQFIHQRYADKIAIPQQRKPKEAPVELKINTITYVNGQDVKGLSAEQQFDLIGRAENEIRKLSTLVNAPKAVAKRITELEEGIAALLRAVDGEDAAPYKPVIVPGASDDSADRG